MSIQKLICITVYVECASPDLGLWLLGDREGLPSEGTLINLTPPIDNNTINWDDFPSFDGYYCIDLDILSRDHLPSLC